jgi:raffinose/stachyose/melibiose transport system substrate-binding protein
MNKLSKIFILGMLVILAFSSCKKAASAASEISVLSMFSNPTADANSIAFYAQIDKFQKDYPALKVTFESIPHDEYETKMKTYIAGGVFPDIVELKGTMIPQLADDGSIFKTKQLMDLVSGWESSYKGGVFEDFTYKNDYWAAPMQMGNNHNIYWNSDILASVGVSEFPTEWNAFIDMLNKLKAAGHTPIVLGNKANWLVPSLLFNTIVYRFTGVDWYYSLRENRGAKFTDPQFVASAVLMQQMAKDGYFNSDINSIDQHQMYTVYYNKQAAMMVDGFWGVGTFDNEMPKDVLAATRVAQFPAVPESLGGGGAKYANINQAAAGWGWAVFKKDGSDAKLQSIANFLYYITGPDYANVVVSNSGLPASNASNVNESALSPLYLQLLELNNRVDYAPVFDVQLNPQIVDAFYSNTQELLIGSLTPQRYAELIQAETDASR